jgi:hypothetical protein
MSYVGTKSVVVPWAMLTTCRKHLYRSSATWRNASSHMNGWETCLSSKPCIALIKPDGQVRAALGGLESAGHDLAHLVIECALSGNSCHKLGLQFGLSCLLVTSLIGAVRFSERQLGYDVVERLSGVPVAPKLLASVTSSFFTGSGHQKGEVNDAPKFRLAVVSVSHLQQTNTPRSQTEKNRNTTLS